MQYVALIVLQSLLYSLMDILGKIAYRTVPVAFFMTVRLTLASLAGLIIFRKTIIRDLRTSRVRTWIVPALCIGLASNLCSLALSYTTATRYGFVRSLGAVIAPLLSCIFLRRKYTGKDAFIQIMLVLGLYLLFSDSDGFSVGRGEIYAFLVAFLMSCSLVFGSKAVRSIDTRTLSFLQSTSGLLFSVVFGLSSGSFSFEKLLLFSDIRIILIVIYTAFAGTLLAYLLQNIAIKHIPSSSVAVIQSLYPVFTSLLGLIILKESLVGLPLIGSVMITVCVVLQSTVRT